MRRFNQLNHPLVVISINPQDAIHVVAPVNVQYVKGEGILQTFMVNNLPVATVVVQELAKSVVAPVNPISTDAVIVSYLFKLIKLL